MNLVSIKSNQTVKKRKPSEPEVDHRQIALLRKVVTELNTLRFQYEQPHINATSLKRKPGIAQQFPVQQADQLFSYKDQPLQRVVDELFNQKKNRIPLRMRVQDF